MSTVKSVLVVEDDPDILDVLKNIFIEEGLEVFTAVDGLDGLAKFKAHNPDIIFADIMMPGLDGQQLTIEIKKLSPETPIILVSGRFTDLLDRHHEGELTCDQVLYKPFTRVDIVQTLSLYQEKQQ
jgi:two-component system, OmpR family, response regulator VanR